MPFPSAFIVALRRMHARDVTISEIQGEGERVSVLCTVVDFDTNKMEGKIDDGTGIALVILEDILFAEKLKPGALVRVLGRAYKSEDGLLIRAEVVQDMDGVDPALYAQIRDLERRVYNEGGV
ncbi:MAG: hypothetical protein PWQ11_18 [Candidatus Diapherotrites archaeon]|nr:hypothetical protein [Candidatus Diapherotrites archaeon]